MIISNKKFDKYFINSCLEDYETTRNHYYLNHEIIPINKGAIIINKNNIGVISEINCKFFISIYKYEILICISSLKELSRFNVGWKYNGSSSDDGIESFYSYEKAKE